MLPPIEFFMGMLAGGILGYIHHDHDQQAGGRNTGGLATWLRNKWGSVRN
jgi:hypothetical protein